MKKTKPNCKVGDTLRVDSDEWSRVYPQGSEGIVTDMSDSQIWVKVTKTNGDHIGASSVWWSPNSSTNPLQPILTVTVTVNVSDAEVRAAREGLRELLYG